MENQTEKKWYQKPGAVVLFLLLFFPIGLILMWKHSVWTKSIRWVVTALIFIPALANLNQTSTSSKSQNSNQVGCSGNGNQNCINQIRSQFRGANKDIVSEQYEGDGIFNIQFIEYGAGAYNAYIRMDCNCEIAHINVRPL